MPVEKTFHYEVPEHLLDICEVGKRVLVPLGGRQVTGYIIATTNQLPAAIEAKGIKHIIDCLDETPLFDQGMLKFLSFVADYYLAPLGEVIKAALPPGINWESYYHVTLTQEGARLAADTLLQTPAAVLLRLIDPQKGASLKRVINAAPSRSLVFSLQRKGLIALEPRLKAARTKEKRVAYVEVTGAAPTSPLTPKEQELLSFIAAGGRQTVAAINRGFKKGSVYVKRLVAKGLVNVTKEEVYREPHLVTIDREEGPFTLTEEQKEGIRRIGEALERGGFHTFLLHGVTGGGKTEVYIRVAEQAIVLGRGVLILVPEISLTPQLVGRLQRRLGLDMGILHSGLSPGERYDQWRRVQRGEVRVVIGARSAIFAPLKGVGLIVVDEEHDTSYKQDEGVRYQARDLAVVRGQREGAVVVLGSATPSLESFHNAKRKRYEEIRLSKRVGGGALPVVEVVDLRGDKEGIFSPRLIEALVENLDAGKQSLLFLNRRGYSRAAICADCGAAFTCRRCSVSLTYHAKEKALICHYCGYRQLAFRLCAECGGGRIRLLGFGTEQVEGEVKKLLPTARVARMDSDVMAGRGSQGRLLRALERGEIDILVGTQMIVKGHDFPMITLVGIIMADVTLHLPDLRGAERCFQLVSQAAGRAGRGEYGGRVIIQTYLPGHYAIQRAKGHDFVGFAEEEIRSRRALRFPPFTRIINIRLSSRNEGSAEQGARRLARQGAFLQRRLGARVEIMGPSPAPLYRIKGAYRWQLLLKGEAVGELQKLGRALMEEARSLKGVRVEVDVDPVSLL